MHIYEYLCIHLYLYQAIHEFILTFLTQILDHIHRSFQPLPLFLSIAICSNSQKYSSHCLLFIRLIPAYILVISELTHFSIKKWLYRLEYSVLYTVPFAFSLHPHSFTRLGQHTPLPNSLKQLHSFLTVFIPSWDSAAS